MAPHPTPRPADRPDRRIALVAMPWPIFNRPSLQLGTLKAFLEANLPGLQVDTFHPYLEIAARLGPELYQQISKDMWLSEAGYAALLFPEKNYSTRALFKKAARKAAGPGRKLPGPGQKSGTGLRAADFDRLTATLADQLDSWLQGQNWHRYKLLGFSICFNQLLSSLTAASRLKNRHPHLPIVFGGSSCAADTGLALLRNFPQIDYVICGEGEKPLLELCEFVAGNSAALPAGPILSRRDMPEKPVKPAISDCQLDELGQLPVPDFSNYFQELKRWFGQEPFIPVLPVEFSRGCWWGKCAFCNLNRQWHGYRAKKPAQMRTEVERLSARHGTLDFTFTDNALPPKAALDFFRQIGKLERDFHFFGEIRTRPQAVEKLDLPACRRGGLTTIQVGIESLSNSLLQRMAKGVAAIDNVAILREALNSAILLEGNLITEFPGSTQAEVEETLRNLDFVLPFNPLTIAVFFLGHDSPIDRRPAWFGIKAIVSHPRAAALFPKALLDKHLLLVKDYRGDRADQRKLWKPVVDKVTAWHEFHHQRGGSALDRPPLSYRDGGTFLLIRQELPGQSKPRTLHHRLTGKSRQIYLYLTKIRTGRALRAQFSTITEKQLLAFLQDLVHKRLLFADNDRYLALAIRQNNQDGKAADHEVTG